MAEIMVESRYLSLEEEIEAAAGLVADDTIPADLMATTLLENGISIKAACAIMQKKVVSARITYGKVRGTLRLDTGFVAPGVTNIECPVLAYKVGEDDSVTFLAWSSRAFGE